MRVNALVTGRVATKAEVRFGLQARQFVPEGWSSPFAHHCWYVYDPTLPEDANAIELWKQSMPPGARANWWKDGKLLNDDLISYDPVKRPRLVLIGGIL